jgi:hypothetical protein
MTKQRKIGPMTQAQARRAVNRAMARKTNRKAKRRTRPAATLVSQAGAPTAVGLIGRRVKRSGVFKPTILETSDLFDVVGLGTNTNAVVYNQTLSPQDLPPASRGKLMARLFAKYRCLSAVIRIESAVPTSAGGQYAAFFDPNPQNNWIAGNAVGALTSMPVQDVAAAWECLRLPIPKAELERETELWTQEDTSERLVTRFGQVVIMNLANSNTTPAGTASVSVWLDATWEFYEPNATAADEPANVFINPGQWACGTAGIMAYPSAATGAFQLKSAYRLYPSIPSTMFDSILDAPYIAFNVAPLRGYCFREEAQAVHHAIYGGDAGVMLPSATPTFALGAVAALEIELPPAIRVPLPYKAVDNI